MGIIGYYLYAPATGYTHKILNPIRACTCSPADHVTWRKVGLSLGISSSILDGIDKHRRGDCLDCFSDVFTCWQQQSTPHSPANWATLVAVLRI